MIRYFIFYKSLQDFLAYPYTPYNLEKKITVSLPGGDLVIDWPDFNQSIILTGPAVFVYEGTLFSEIK
jgi:diaminopimelate epimerase